MTLKVLSQSIHWIWYGQLFTTATNPAEGIDPTTVPQTFTNATELANRGITLGTNVQVETQVVDCYCGTTYNCCL